MEIGGNEASTDGNVEGSEVDMDTTVDVIVTEINSVEALGETDVKTVEPANCKADEVTNIEDAGGDVKEIYSAGNELETAGNKEGKEVKLEVYEVETGTAGNEEATGELDDRTLKGILGISMILISSIVSKLVPAA